jgi:cell division septal protein FtsQ
MFKRKKSPLKSTRLAERKRRIRIIKGIAIGVLIVAVIGSALWILHRPALALTTIAVSGNSAVDTSDVQNIVSKDISGRYWYIIPKNNRFLYPKSVVTAHVLEAFPRFESVTVQGTANTLSLAVVERDPSYIWCNGTPQQKNDDDCYFIDSRGYIFSKAAIVSGNVFFHFYGLVGTTSPIGTYYMEEVSFKSLDKLITSLTTLGIESYALQADEKGTNILYLKNGGKLLFQQAPSYSDLVVSISTIANQTDIFSPEKQLEYVDFRYGNKVFYKAVGDKEPTEETQ